MLGEIGDVQVTKAVWFVESGNCSCMQLKVLSQTLLYDKFASI